MAEPLRHATLARAAAGKPLAPSEAATLAGEVDLLRTLLRKLLSATDCTAADHATACPTDQAYAYLAARALQQRRRCPAIEGGGDG